MTEARREPETARFRMVWKRPRAYRYAVSRPGVRLGLNRYQGVVIGVALVAGRHAYCVLWGAPGATKEDS